MEVEGQARRKLQEIKAVAWLGWKCEGGRIWDFRGAGIAGKELRWGMGGVFAAGGDLGGGGAGRRGLPWSVGSVQGWRRGFSRSLLAVVTAVADVREVVGWLLRLLGWSGSDLRIGSLFGGYLVLLVYFVHSVSVIRVVVTHYALILSRIRFIAGCSVKWAIWIPRMVFVTPIWLEFSFGALFLRDSSTGCPDRRASQIPRRVFVTPIWPELSFGAIFLRELMPLGILFLLIWYSDALQKIMFGKRIITVVGGFGPQSLVGDPILVVYSLGVFCIFNGFVCLFHSTSRYRDLYVLLSELLSAVIDFVQFKD